MNLQKNLITKEVSEIDSFLYLLKQFALKENGCYLTDVADSVSLTKLDSYLSTELHEHNN